MLVPTDSIERLSREIRSCQKCRLAETRIQALPGEAQPDARILLIGESPGATEDRVGRNFCGPSGRFLDLCLAQAGLSRCDVNVSPVLHCHPPRNRNPYPDEAEACLPYLHRHIALTDPAIIVVLGGVAVRWYLREKAVTPLVGQWRQQGHRSLLVTYHPAAGMRFPQKRQAMFRDFRSLADRARELLR